MSTIGTIIGLILAVRIFLIAKVVVPEGYAGLLYRNGRLVRQLPPGRCYFLRTGASWRLVDTRLRIMNITGQEVLSQDNLTLKLSAAVSWRIIDAAQSQHVAQDCEYALRTAVQLHLRDALAEHPLEHLIASRSRLGDQVLSEVSNEAAAFGIQVHSVDVKDLTLPAELKRIFHEVVKAQQQGRAALERARGESAALRNLANAARVLEQSPVLMDLRLLQTVSAEGGNTLVFKWPGRQPRRPHEDSGPTQGTENNR